jgi:hypothetical protein
MKQQPDVVNECSLSIVEAHDDVAEATKVKDRQGSEKDNASSCLENRTLFAAPVAIIDSRFQSFA